MYRFKFLAVACSLAWLTGVAFGLYNWFSTMGPYYDSASLALITNVSTRSARGERCERLSRGFSSMFKGFQEVLSGFKTFLKHILMDFMCKLKRTSLYFTAV